MREHEGYLDEEIKTVSARQTETFEVLSYWFAICCWSKLVVKLITRKSHRRPSCENSEIETSQIHRIHPSTPATIMMGTGLTWDFQKRSVHPAAIT